MIKTITVTTHLGDSVTLDLARPELSGFAVMSIEGLGPGKATINTADMSTIDGSIFSSAKLPKRNILMSLRYLWQDSIEDVRQRSYKYFPIKQNITLTIETDNRHVEIDGYVESNSPHIFSRDSWTDISIICPDPYFRSVGADGNAVTVFSGVEPAFEFPFAIEDSIEFGVINKSMDKAVTYYGDAEVGITLTIHALGEASNVLVYNSSTRETMKIDTAKLATLTGAGITAGDDIVICTEQGRKKITLFRGGKTYNILNCLDKNSNWFKLYRGDNVFGYTADTGAENLQFMIENRVLYEGV